MPRRTKLTLTAFVVFILLSAVAYEMWNVRAQGGPERVGPLVGAAIGGPFRLIDQDRVVRTSASYKGRYRLMYFGYTYCPDICPTDVQKMSKALRLFEASDPRRAARVQPIMVTIDPERDTPAVMKQFVSAFHPRLVGLTGTAAQINDIRSRFAIYAQRQGPATSGNYLMDHSAMAYLMGPSGEPITFFARDATPAQMAAELSDYVS